MRQMMTEQTYNVMDYCEDLQKMADELIRDMECYGATVAEAPLEDLDHLKTLINGAIKKRARDLFEILDDLECEADL